MINQDVKTFVLKALLKRNGPLSHDTLKMLVRSAFSGVALTDGDLKQWVEELQDAGHIAGTNDDLLGLVWDLTTKGKIKVQSL